MSSEQPELQTLPAEQPEVQSQTLPFVVDTSQQATSPTPSPHVKNPNRVAAGKMVAERTRIAREQKKKAAAEAALANKNVKSATSPSEPEPKAESGLSVNQWIGIGGLVVSAVGLFLKREEIMAALPSPPTPPVETPPPTIEPVPKRKGIRKMD